MSSRVYVGRYRVLLRTERNEWDTWPPVVMPAEAYEECERFLFAIGHLGLPYEGRRVLRALIVPSGA